MQGTQNSKRILKKRYKIGEITSPHFKPQYKTTYSRQSSTDIRIDIQINKTEFGVQN